MKIVEINWMVNKSYLVSLTDPMYETTRIPLAGLSGEKSFFVNEPKFLAYFNDYELHIDDIDSGANAEYSVRLYNLLNSVSPTESLKTSSLCLAGKISSPGHRLLRSFSILYLQHGTPLFKTQLALVIPIMLSLRYTKQPVALERSHHNLEDASPGAASHPLLSSSFV